MTDDSNEKQKSFMTSSLMNERENYNCTMSKQNVDNCTKFFEKYNMNFQKKKKYFLRLINISIDNT